MRVCLSVCLCADGLFAFAAVGEVLLAQFFSSSSQSLVAVCVCVSVALQEPLSAPHHLRGRRTRPHHSLADSDSVAESIRISFRATSRLEPDSARIQSRSQIQTTMKRVGAAAAAAAGDAV